jgi:hypothetical protein
MWEVTVNTFNAALELWILVATGKALLGVSMMVLLGGVLFEDC